MNFIKLIFIIFIINGLSGQAIATPKTIKPLVQINSISSESTVSFIGVEQGEISEVAKLYDINKNNVIMPLEKTFSVKACVQEGCASYFSAGHYGDITGEGKPELILLITNPSYGTQVLIWETQENGSFSMLEKPYLINSNKSSSEAINSFLETIYPDKDKELVISLGSPDRKVVILNYDGKISSKTIAEEFLENTVGPLVLKLEDFNNDNLKDIYILNNGIQKEEQTYFSPEHFAKDKKTNAKQELYKDLLFYNTGNQKIKISLLKDGTLYIPAWEKEIGLSLSNATNLLKINGDTLLILNSKGDIGKYLIKNDKETIDEVAIIKNKFRQTGYDKVEFLILQDERIILSHNKNPEIIIEHLYEKEEIVAKNTKVEERNKENIQEIGSVQAENQTPNKKLDISGPITSAYNNQNNTEAPSLVAIKKLDQDTIFVNTGELTSIKIDFNSDYEFLDLEEITTPNNMSLDVSSLSFLWTPQKTDAGYNKLRYIMSYNKNKSLTKVEENGKIKLRKNFEKTQTEYSYVIFVNSPPEIKIEKKDYTIQEDRELIVPIYISDVNSEQNLSLDFSPEELEKAYVSDRKFYWTPKKINYGKNNITFKVSDGYVNSYENINVFVDTTKAVLQFEQELITTVNKEFIHRLAVLPGTQLEVLKGPENLRISKDGTIHWIPTYPELGDHFIQIEIKEKNQTSLYEMKVFVNAEPVISYRPDLIEYIDLNEEFIFNCKSFDQNIDQKLFWSLRGPTGMTNSNGSIQWKATQEDYVFYALSLTDNIDTTVFNGAIYVNDKPKIASIPPQYIKLGDTLIYNIEVIDKNNTSPFNMQEDNDHIYYLDQAPKGMILQGSQIIWIPSATDVGPNQIKISVSDGIEPAEQSFILFVNDQPTITSINELKIQLGDTLHHFIKAQDANPLSRLTYGINSDLDTMTLNGKTGEIFWAPRDNDLGKHKIEVSVSDGFDLSKDVQTINILVYKNPEFQFQSLPEAYAGTEYKFYLKAIDMFLNSTPGKDVFVKIKKTTLNEIYLDSLTHNLTAFPAYDEVGQQKISFELFDSFDNIIEKEFDLKVLTSPCETSDTVYVDNQEVVSRLQKIDKSIVYASKNEKIKIGNETSLLDTIYITKYDTTITNITDSIFVVVEEKKKEEIKELSSREKRKLARKAKRAARQAKKLAQRTKNLDEIAKNKANQKKEQEQNLLQKETPPIVKTEYKKINIVNKETVVVEKVLAQEETIKEKAKPTIEKVNQIKFIPTNVPIFDDSILGVKTTSSDAFKNHNFGIKSIQTNQKIKFKTPEFLDQDMYWYKK